MKLSDALRHSTEPHRSLAAFLSDIYEQCEMFAADRKDSVGKSVMSFVLASLATAGAFISLDLEHRGKE